MFVLPQGTNDLFGILHKYKHITWSAEASSNIEEESLVNNPQIIYPEYAFGSDEFEWGSKVGDLSPWISILFPKHKIALSHYVFKSPSHITGSYFPRCWDVYGKKDNNWTKISSVNESGLNGKSIIKVFPMFNNTFFKGFKFHMTCRNYHSVNSPQHDGEKDWLFIVNQIDFFGIIQPYFISTTIHITRCLPLFSIFLL